VKALTVRNVDARLARALEREMRKRGTSLNQTVLDLLRDSLGVGVLAPSSNGLEKLAGTWTQKDLEEFEANTAIFEQIDPELWS
jgi:DNA polymerase III delta subunit